MRTSSWTLLLSVCVCMRAATASAASVEDLTVYVDMGGPFEPGNEYDLTLETPEGAPPAGGWPVVFLFHGAGQSRENWSHCSKSFGVFTVCGMKRFKEKLLAGGFATIAGNSKRHTLGLDKEPTEYWAAWHRGNYSDAPGVRINEVPYAVRRERETAANPDLQFVVQVLRELGTHQQANGTPMYDINDAYVAGFSNGGLFAMFVAQYLPEYIRAGAIESAGYAPAIPAMPPAIRGQDALNWQGEIPRNHPPMIVVNTLGFDWVLNGAGIEYKDDLIRSGIQACHFTYLGGLHAWHEVFDAPILELFSMRDKVLPTNPFCRPKDFSPAARP